MISLSSRFFGVSLLCLGVAGLALHDQLTSNWQLSGAAAFIIVTSIVEILGGLAMQFAATARAGAMVLGVLFAIFSLTFVPDIAAHPMVYASWGDIFYQLSIVVGALIACAVAPRAAAILYGLCCVSFAIEQIEFLVRTSSLVPAWMPLGGVFWTWATTVAFGLGGIALITGYRALLASRLLALMLLLFGVAIWIPLLIAAPATHSNWSEGLETFATGFAAWIVADYLKTKRAVT